MPDEPAPLPRLEDLFEQYFEQLRAERATRDARAEARAAEEARDPAKAALAHLSVQEWQLRAMQAAGIDPDHWDPSDGFKANEDNIERVYALYAQWYLAHPELKWAGMAKLAGGSVYGGLQQLVAERPSWGLRDLVTPILAYDGIKGMQMDKVERIFVSMQKNIFMDLAWQHQAYVEGGLNALKAAYDRGDLSAANYEAWVKIAAGDDKACWEGNKTLLLREQSEVLPPDYERIQDLWFGGSITEEISGNTVSPIPHGASFRELYPDGNVTNFEDRWRWIEDHMLPEYQALGDQYTRDLVSQPLQELADRKFAPDPRRSP
jgi:hypothetical protein